jgi:xylulokinase
MTFLGLDLGTSAVKAVLVDDRQRVIAEASASLSISRPRPGWSEQSPEDWWKAAVEVAAALRQKNKAALEAVRALSVSGQMHGAVLLDRAGKPLRPAILWNDNRAVAQCAALEAAVPDLGSRAGIAAMPGFTAPKLLWVRQNEPDVFARIAMVVSPKDYLRLRLTGTPATDMSDAAGTLWLDQGRRDWSDDVLAASGLSRSHVPPLLEGNAAAGEVDRSVQVEWGLAGPVVVAAGAGDAAAAAIGIGAVNPGDAFISLGTSAQLFMTEDRYRPQPGSLLHAFAHGLPDRWYRMAAMLNGASCLEWIARLLGEREPGALIQQAEQTYNGPSRVLFLPYLSGERTPHDDPSARGVFAGLDASAGAGDIVHATLEGVAFSLVEACDCFEAAGTKLGTLAVVGGGARSHFWVQLLANALRRPLVRYSGSELGPAFGAARLARMALTGESPEAVCTKPEVLDQSSPDATLSAGYAKRFDNYQALYRGLRPTFRSMAAEPAKRQQDAG